MAWEAVRQLLAQGKEIAGIAFHEVSQRAAFAQVRSGPIPVDATNIWRLGHHYCPEPLRAFLTHLMTHEWHAARWWQPWQQVASVGIETVLLPDGAAHAERMTTAVRDRSEDTEA